ncbi:unnamed protein product [Rhizophagus irregularis]|nr:unnamed protein product [Rhizophagus irregularis]
MYQCLLLVSDLKLGHYMKILPRSMFISQFYGTVVGGFMNYWVLRLIISSKRQFLDGTMEDPTGQVSGTFGPNSLYRPILWGFLIGAFVPIPFYLLHRKYPKYRFDLVNQVLQVNSMLIDTRINYGKMQLKWSVWLYSYFLTGLSRMVGK